MVVAHPPSAGATRARAEPVNSGEYGMGLYMTTSGKPLFDGAGRFRGSRGVSSDVTAAARAVQAESVVARSALSPSLSS